MLDLKAEPTNQGTLTAWERKTRKKRLLKGKPEE